MASPSYRRRVVVAAFVVSLLALAVTVAGQVLSWGRRRDELAPALTAGVIYRPGDDKPYLWVESQGPIDLTEITVTVIQDAWGPISGFPLGHGEESRSWRFNASLPRGERYPAVEVTGDPDHAGRVVLRCTCKATWWRRWVKVVEFDWDPPGDILESVY
jgi:hypothetical protein